MRTTYPIASLAVSLLFASSACTETNLRPDDTGVIAPDTDHAVDTDPAVDTDVDTDTERGTCEPFAQPAQEVSTTDCRVPFGTLTFTEKWRLKAFSVPLIDAVMHTDDDNGDGFIGWGDTPSVHVYRENKSYGYPGVWQLDGETGAVQNHWPDVNGYFRKLGPGLPMAGAHVWTVPWHWTWTQDLAGSVYRTSSIRFGDSCGAAWSFSDLNGDGYAEFIAPWAQYSWATDTELVIDPPPIGWKWSNGDSRHCSAYALDLDGKAPGQVLVGNRIFNWDGNLRCAVPTDDGMSWPADFDGDGVLDILLINRDEMVLADTACRVVKRRSTHDAFNADSISMGSPGLQAPVVAPLMDTTGTDLALVVMPYQGTTPKPPFQRYVVIDGNLDVHDIPYEGGLGYGDRYGAIADLDEDGLYEHFRGQDYVDPRTGAVLGSLGVPYGAWVQAVADIDGDGHAEILAIVCTDETCGWDIDIVAFEGDDLAMAPVNYMRTYTDRSGVEYDDGTAVQAGQYPSPDEYNTINAPEFSDERAGYGVELELAFASVCTEECWRYELPVHVTVANRGVTDLVHPVEVRLIGSLAGTEKVLDAFVIDHLPSGRQTEARLMEVEPAWTRAAGLRLEAAPVDRPLRVCTSMPVLTYTGETCAAPDG